jgi:hypothetical protein
MTTNDRTRRILAMGDSAPPFSPCAYYDRDGDFIESFVRDEGFKGQRLDKWVTVYIGRESGEIVGSCVKDVRKLMALYPGLDIEIEEGDEVALSYILRAPAWSEGDPVKLKTYRALIRKAEEANLRAVLEPVG